MVPNSVVLNVAVIAQGAASVSNHPEVARRPPHAVAPHPSRGPLARGGATSLNRGDSGRRSAGTDWSHARARRAAPARPAGESSAPARIRNASPPRVGSPPARTGASERNSSSTRPPPNRSAFRCGPPSQRTCARRSARAAPPARRVCRGRVGLGADVFDLGAPRASSPRRGQDHHARLGSLSSGRSPARASRAETMHASGSARRAARSAAHGASRGRGHSVRSVRCAPCPRRRAPRRRARAARGRAQGRRERRTAPERARIADAPSTLAIMLTRDVRAFGRPPDGRAPRARSSAKSAPRSTPLARRAGPRRGSGPARPCAPQ